MALCNLEHQLIKFCRVHNLADEKVMVACSGGLDSMALLVALVQVAKVLKIQIAVAHVHHGPGLGGEYREQAALLVQRACERLSLPLFKRRSEKDLGDSEETLRVFRHKALEEMRVEAAAHYICTAHHQDDLLETRLLRLVRGTGLEGLAAMGGRSARLLRPFIEVSKSELLEYAKLRGVEFCEDPSNESLEPLRNWVRHDWLPMLEKKQKGATQSLARSLKTIVSEYDQLKGDGHHNGLIKEAIVQSASGAYELDLGAYLALTQQQQITLLARYLRLQKHYRFSQGQLAEIQKQLSSGSKHKRLVLLGLEWIINAERISLNPSAL